MAKNKLDTWYKQYLILEALCHLGTVEAACKQVKIGRTTYYRWLKDPDFIKSLKDKKRFVYEHSINSMKNLFSQAVSSYQDLLYSKNDAIRLKATSEIIKNASIIIDTKEKADQYEEWLEMSRDLEQPDSSNDVA